LAEILELYVRKDFRRRGVGRALMAEAERRLRVLGYQWVQLEVLEHNRPAREFYRGLRFQTSDLRLLKALQSSGRRNRVP
jgi:ribosomal protein S18 acetylase RimI-like enzyme